MAAICRGMGEVKKAMSGKRMSWLWTMMVLCDVMIAEQADQKLIYLSTVLRKENLTINERPVPLSV